MRLRPRRLHRRLDPRPRAGRDGRLRARPRHARAARSTPALRTSRRRACSPPATSSIRPRPPTSRALDGRHVAAAVAEYLRRAAARWPSTRPGRSPAPPLRWVVAEPRRARDGGAAAARSLPAALGAFLRAPRVEVAAGRADAVARPAAAPDPRALRAHPRGWAAQVDPTAVPTVASSGVGSRMSDQLLLGVDEGTTGVKAALFDERLQPVREARRDKVNRHPEEGWVEQDGEEVLAAVVEAIAELLEDPPGEVVACGLDHQGESMLAWDAESGKPLSPIVVWQDKRSQEVLDTPDRRARRRSRSSAASPSTPTSPPPSWPGCWRTTTACRRRATRAPCGWAPWTPSSATGSAPASPPMPSTGSRTQLQTDRHAGLRPPALRDLRRSRSRSCPRSATPPASSAPSRTRAGRSSFAAARPDRRPAGGARGRRLRRAGTRQGDLRHRRLRARARRRGGPEPRRRPAARRSPGASTASTEYALDGGVFAAGAMLEWLCKELGLAEDPPALSQLAREADGSAGARVLPGLAGLGAPWWRPNARAVISGVYGGTTRRERRPRRVSRESPGASPTSSPRSARRVDVDVLRVDGGAHQRAADAPASGRRDRGAGRGRRGGRDRARRRGPGGGRARGWSPRSPRPPRCCRPTAASSRSATRRGAEPSTTRWRAFVEATAALDAGPWLFACTGPSSPRARRRAATDRCGSLGDVPPSPVVERPSWPNRALVAFVGTRAPRRGPRPSSTSPRPAACS